MNATLIAPTTQNKVPLFAIFYQMDKQAEAPAHESQVAGVRA